MRKHLKKKKKMNFLHFLYPKLHLSESTTNNSNETSSWCQTTPNIMANILTPKSMPHAAQALATRIFSLSFFHPWLLQIDQIEILPSKYLTKRKKKMKVTQSKGPNSKMTKTTSLYIALQEKMYHWLLHFYSFSCCTSYLFWYNVNLWDELLKISNFFALV